MRPFFSRSPNGTRQLQHTKSTSRNFLTLGGFLGTLAVLLFLRLAISLDSGTDLQSSRVGPTEIEEVWEPVAFTPEEAEYLNRFADQQVDPKDGRMWRLDSQRFSLSGNVGRPHTELEERIKQIRYSHLLEPLEPPVENLLLEGNLNWMRGNRTAAKSKWTAVTVKFSRWDDQVLEARLNLARAALLEKQLDTAIQTLLPILNRPDPEVSNLGDHLDKSIACRELSDLFLEQGDLRNALKHLNLARTKYKVPQCAFASDFEEEEYSARIKVIEHAILTKAKLEIKPLKPVAYRRRNDPRGIASTDLHYDRN